MYIWLGIRKLHVEGLGYWLSDCSIALYICINYFHPHHTPSFAYDGVASPYICNYGGILSHGLSIRGNNRRCPTSSVPTFLETGFSGNVEEGYGDLGDHEGDKLAVS